MKEISETGIGIRAKICNYIQGKHYDANAHPYPNFNGGLGNQARS